MGAAAFGAGSVRSTGGASAAVAALRADAEAASLYAEAEAAAEIMEVDGFDVGGGDDFFFGDGDDDGGERERVEAALLSSPPAAARAGGVSADSRLSPVPALNLAALQLAGVEADAGADAGGGLAVKSAGAFAALPGGDLVTPLKPVPSQSTAKQR